MRREVAIARLAWERLVSTSRCLDLHANLAVLTPLPASPYDACHNVAALFHIATTMDIQDPGVFNKPWLSMTFGRWTTWLATIIAVAVNTEGKREIVGLHIGPFELAAPPRALGPQRAGLRAQNAAKHGSCSNAPSVHPARPPRRQPHAMDFPVPYRVKLHSTNPLERLNNIYYREDVIAPKEVAGMTRHQRR